MCISVPQMVVRVIRITASPTPAHGRGTSSTEMLFDEWKTVAFIFLSLVSVIHKRYRANSKHEHADGGAEHEQCRDHDTSDGERRARLTFHDFAIGRD